MFVTHSISSTCYCFIFLCGDRGGEWTWEGGIPVYFHCVEQKMFPFCLCWLLFFDNTNGKKGIFLLFQKKVNWILIKFKFQPPSFHSTQTTTVNNNNRIPSDFQCVPFFLQRCSALMASCFPARCVIICLAKRWRPNLHVKYIRLEKMMRLMMALVVVVVVVAAAHAEPISILIWRTKCKMTPTHSKRCWWLRPNGPIIPGVTFSVHSIRRHIHVPPDVRIGSKRTPTSAYIYCSLMSVCRKSIKGKCFYELEKVFLMWKIESSGGGGGRGSETFSQNTAIITNFIFKKNEIQWEFEKIAPNKVAIIKKIVRFY